MTTFVHIVSVCAFCVLPPANARFFDYQLIRPRRNAVSNLCGGKSLTGTGGENQHDFDYGASVIEPISLMRETGVLTSRDAFARIRVPRSRDMPMRVGNPWPPGRIYKKPTKVRVQVIYR